MSVDHLPPVDRTETLRPPPAERQPRVRPVGQATEDRWERSRDEPGEADEGAQRKQPPEEETGEEPRHFDRRA